jgi:hypothetical protein
VITQRKILLIDDGEISLEQRSQELELLIATALF